MNCPKCGTEVGTAEFCPSCLSKVNEPARKGEVVEAEVAKKEAEASRVQLEVARKSGRKAMVYVGAVLIAVVLGVVAAAVVDVVMGKDAPVAGERLVRIRCVKDDTCGVDPCGRKVKCIEGACTRTDLSPCQK